jgi:hypothetical protein
MYGSIHEEKGLSFTESEYDYAVENNVPVLAFLHENINNLPGGKIESRLQRKKMLERFREKVQSRWNVEFWSDERELPRLISVRLNNAIGFADRPGWVRGNSIPEALQSEIAAILDPCRLQGIIRVVPDGKADSRTMTLNLESSKEIRIMVTSGTRFLDSYRRALSKAIAGGAHVRVLLPRPESDFVRDVGESEREGEGGGKRKAEIAQEIREAEARFSEYMSEANKITPAAHGGAISVGYYTTHLRSTMILCDNRWGWLTITLPPLRAAETLSLELQQTERECLLNDCIRHFDRTWDIIESRNHVTRI